MCRSSLYRFENPLRRKNGRSLFACGKFPRKADRLAQTQRQAHFSAVCSRRAAEMGTHYPSLSVTKAKTRWGSCSYNDALHFSFRLLYAPMAVIDYVIVHELSHTFYKNTAKKFWALVERYVPDYRKKRAWLKKALFDGNILSVSAKNSIAFENYNSYRFYMKY